VRARPAPGGPPLAAGAPRSRAVLYRRGALRPGAKAPLRSMAGLA